MFSSNTSTPMRAVATPETAIGTMTADRNRARAGSTEFSSTAAPRPSAIDRGVTRRVKRTVFAAARQNSGSRSSRA